MRCALSSRVARLGAAPAHRCGCFASRLLMPVLVALEASNGLVSPLIRSRICHLASKIHSSAPEQFLGLLVFGEEDHHRPVCFLRWFAEPANSLDLDLVLFRHRLNRFWSDVGSGVGADTKSIDSVDLDGIPLLS